MKISRITSFDELSKFIPELTRIHEDLEGRWEPDMTTAQFLGRLVEFFVPRNYYFGELTPEGKLIYFITLLPEDKPCATFWLFYMNKDFRDITATLLENYAQWAVSEGYTTIYSQSTRSEKSYERWLNKFGATKVATVYKFNLLQ